MREREPAVQPSPCSYHHISLRSETGGPERGVNQFKYHLAFKLILSTWNISTSTRSLNAQIYHKNQRKYHLSLKNPFNIFLCNFFLPSSLPSPAISAIKLLKNAHLLKINVHENTAQVLIQPIMTSQF